MKKPLLLLLLPVCVLGQEDKKPRKLFYEIKQGVCLEHKKAPPNW
jgi:hypothetical protein